LSTFALLFRIIEILFPDNSSALALTYYSRVQIPTVEFTAVFQGIVAVLAIIPNLTAFILCLGFWVDVLLSRFNKVYSIRIKIISFTGSAFVGGLSLIGLLFIFVIPNTSTIGKFLLVIPFFVTIIGEIFTCIVIAKWKVPSEGVSKDTMSYTDLKNWSLPLFIGGTVLWCLHTFALILAAASSSPPLWLILSVFWLLNSAATTFINFNLTSRKLGIVPLSRWLFFGEEIPDSATTSQSKEKSSSATGTSGE